MTLHLTGIHVPLVTPFTDSGELAATHLERLAHTVIDEGAAGIVALGTTAEPATLSPQERRDVLRICSRVCGERGVPLLVGAGSNSTADTVRAIDEVDRQADVAAVLAVVPYYTRPSEAGVVAHFEHVADRSPRPLVLYNIPYRTGQHLGWESVLRLSEHPRIVGVKQAVGAVDTDTALLLSQAADTFSVLAGEDALVSPLLAMGAAGAIAATANVCTPELAELFRLWRNGTPAQARTLGQRLVPLVCRLMSEPNPTVVKAVLHAQGRIPTPDVRLPLLPAGEPSAIVAALEQLRLQYAA
ncbi:4-hydroxy-tetrahydrodipicolinate synthase [Rhodococcus olei]|uniref:4-hydroxy-tetrahydrodipicolinate synthase n=1 Tax=Rhodococcus olei TaxID=2161675 RepID=A0ABP8P7N9_9NOCA